MLCFKPLTCSVITDLSPPRAPSGPHLTSTRRCNGCGFKGGQRGLAGAFVPPCVGGAQLWLGPCTCTGLSSVSAAVHKHTGASLTSAPVLSGARHQLVKSASQFRDCTVRTAGAWQTRFRAVPARCLGLGSSTTHSSEVADREGFSALSRGLGHGEETVDSGDRGDRGGRHPTQWCCTGPRCCIIAALVENILGQQFFAASAVQWHVTFLNKVNSLLCGSLRALPMLLQSEFDPVINRIFQPVNHTGKHATILSPPALKNPLLTPPCTIVPPVLLQRC